jgi:hypothetical protein
VNPDFSDILSAFSAEGVEFLVVGAYALAAHGLRVPVLSREHLIQNKRATGRPQDLADLAWLERRVDG